MGFPTKNDHFGGTVLGVPPFKETPISSPRGVQRPFYQTGLLLNDHHFRMKFTINNSRGLLLCDGLGLTGLSCSYHIDINYSEIVRNTLSVPLVPTTVEGQHGTGKRGPQKQELPCFVDQGLHLLLKLAIRLSNCCMLNRQMEIIRCGLLSIGNVASQKFKSNSRSVAELIGSCKWFRHDPHEIPKEWLLSCWSKVYHHCRIMK